MLLRAAFEESGTELPPHPTGTPLKGNLECAFYEVFGVEGRGEEGVE